MKLDSDFKPKRVLCVGAHPDDLEITLGGSVAKWVESGAEVYYLICTDGSKGSGDRQATPAGLTKIRREEQRQAAKLLGVKDVTFLDYEDGACTVSLELKMDICREIRHRQPDVVCCMDPTMVYSAELGYINHPDHRVVGQATLDAVFPLARDHMTFPQLLEEGLEPHKTATILLTNFGAANFAVDVTETFELKLKALAAHVSQFHDMEAIEKFARDLGGKAGNQAGVELAEGFVRIDVM